MSIHPAGVTSSVVPLDVRKMSAADVSLARTTFAMMAEVFEGEPEPLDDAYVQAMLTRPDVWAIVARRGSDVVGGLTAFALPLTRKQESELFIYDVAVLPSQQRRGVGRAMVEFLRREGAAAGIHVAFVPADNEDTHALDFYRALGGTAAPVTIFTFGDEE